MRQAQILDFIREVKATKGYAPTIREIGDAIGLKSTSTIWYHLAGLKRAEKIHWEPRLNRSITIVGEEAPIIRDRCPTCGKPA
ncbi:MAG: hypothetical protein KGL39_45925 [Patescibacteria group bacterium]|nr:hypothetical protein [Patescibacteria group bacterium]